MLEDFPTYEEKTWSIEEVTHQKHDQNIMYSNKNDVLKNLRMKRMPAFKIRKRQPNFNHK